jgi:hypothetical protein
MAVPADKTVERRFPTADARVDVAFRVRRGIGAARRT